MRIIKVLLIFIISLSLLNFSPNKREESYITKIYLSNDETLVVDFLWGRQTTIDYNSIITNIEIVDGELFIYDLLGTKTSLGKIIGFDGSDGVDSKEVSFNVTSSFLQWKYSDSDTWTNLIDLDLLVGDKGIDGTDGTDSKDVEFSVISNGLYYKYSDTDSWIKLFNLKTSSNEFVYDLDFDLNEVLDYQNDYYTYLYNELVDTVVTIETYYKNVEDEYIKFHSGSGVIVYEDIDYAYIYTNASVVSGLIDNSRFYDVIYANGVRVLGEVLVRDIKEDVALVRVDRSNNYKIAKMGNSNLVKVGMSVFTISSPLSLNHYNDFGFGRIVNKNVEIVRGVGNQYSSNTIQIDLVINEGDYGSPLFNLSGELIGINTHKYLSNEEILFGFNFSLLINHVNKILETTISNGVYKRPSLGVLYYDIYSMSNPNRDTLETELFNGLIVYNNQGHSLIRSGDTIVGINDKSFITENDFKEILYNYLPGDEISLNIIRNNEEIVLDIVLVGEGS